MAKQTYEELVFTADASKAIAAVSRLEVKIKKLTAAYEDSDKRTKESRAIRDELAASVDKLNLATSRETTSIKQNTSAHNNSTNAINAEIQALQAENRNLDMNSDKFKKNTVAISQHANKMNQATKATGGTASATMELSRIVSDAPYGIRGVANNLSQFTSQMYYAAAAAGGLGKAFKQMWSSLMGPLGVVLAITAVISAMDFFAGSTKKAEKEADGLDSTLSGLASTLDGLELSQKEVNKRMNEYVELLALKSKVEKEDKILSDKRILNNKEIDKAEANIAYQRKKMRDEENSPEIRKKAKGFFDAAVARLDMLKTKEQSFFKQSLANNTAYIKAKDEIGRGGDSTLQLLNEQLSKLKENREAVSKDNKQYLIETDKIIAKEKEIQAITGETDDPKEPKDPKKPKKAFSLIDFDDTKTVKKFLKEQELLLAKSNVEKLAINQKYRVQDLQAVFDNEKKKDQIKLDTYLNSEASDEQKQKAKDLFNQKQIDSETKHEDALIELNLAGAYKRGQLNIKIEEDFRGTMHQNQLERTQAHLATMSNLLSDNSVESLEFLHEAQREVWAVEDEIFKQSLEKKREKLTAQGFDFAQIQIEIDEDKFAREQEVADREVQLEIDKINRKKEVNEEYVSYISGLGDVFAAFGKKNEFLAIAGLALQKGAEIASVVIKTTAANSEISAAAAKDYSAAVTAGNSSVSQGFALMGNPITASIGSAMVTAGGVAVASAKAIPAAATLAKNKNRIKAGMSIAKIASTTLTSGALGGDSGDSGGGGSTGGGGGGSTSFAPSFNVVGNSNENQLAEGIGGQVNMPTRAYVVYDDIQQAGSVVEESIESSGI